MVHPDLTPPPTLSPAPTEAWPAAISRGLRASWAWLRAWHTAPEAAADPSRDPHLWAEGPLPSGLAQCLGCASEAREAHAATPPYRLH